MTWVRDGRDPIQGRDEKNAEPLFSERSSHSGQVPSRRARQANSSRNERSRLLPRAYSSDSTAESGSRSYQEITAAIVILECSRGRPGSARMLSRSAGYADRFSPRSAAVTLTPQPATQRGPADCLVASRARGSTRIAKPLLESTNKQTCDAQVKHESDCDVSSPAFEHKNDKGNGPRLNPACFGRLRRAAHGGLLELHGKGAP